MMNYYVYVLKRPDNTPFYVGKGKGSRWKSHVKRALNKSNTTNPHKRNVILKILRYKEHIYTDIYMCENENKAFELEIYMIRELSKEYKLTNKTNGGEGVSGYKHTKETILRISGKKKGNKYGPMPFERRLKIAAAHRGMKASLSARKKMSIAKIKKPIKEFLEYKKTPQDEEKRRLAWLASVPSWRDKASKTQIKLNKERQAKGLLHVRAKINPNIVLEMRTIRKEQKLSFDKIAKLFDVSASLVKQVIKKQTWKYV